MESSLRRTVRLRLFGCWRCDIYYCQLSALAFTLFQAGGAHQTAFTWQI